MADGSSRKLLSQTSSSSSFFLTACLLYSRLVLNLHKFIRHKLLLPHILLLRAAAGPLRLLSAPSHSTFSSFISFDSPHPACLHHALALRPVSSRRWMPAARRGTSCSSRAACFSGWGRKNVQNSWRETKQEKEENLPEMCVGPRRNSAVRFIILFSVFVKGNKNKNLDYTVVPTDSWNTWPNTFSFLFFKINLCICYCCRSRYAKK